MLLPTFWLLAIDSCLLKKGAKCWNEANKSLRFGKSLKKRTQTKPDRTQTELIAISAPGRKLRGQGNGLGMTEAAVLTATVLG